MMLISPKKRTCPSRNCRICWNMRRQPAGERKGKRPSITRTRATAVQKLSLFKVYFLAGTGAGPLLPRSTLKNSDEGSSTITSLFLLKLVLYASRLR